jgi:hypothetical protein
MGIKFRSCIQASHFNRCANYEIDMYNHCRSDSEYPVQLTGVCRWNVNFTERQTCELVLDRIVNGGRHGSWRLSAYDEWIHECITWYLKNNKGNKT